MQKRIIKYSLFSLFILCFLSGCVIDFPNDSTDSTMTPNENEDSTVLPGENNPDFPVETTNPTIQTGEATMNDKEIKPIGNISSGKDYYDELKTIDLYNDLFDLENKVTISINISSSELKKIEEDYNSNTYRLADSVTISINYKNGKTISKTLLEVGIRMKGNTSRNSFFDKNNNTIYDLCHYKLSFQETFDDEIDYASSDIKIWQNKTDRTNRKNRTFFGLGALELKYNSEGDLTYTREAYSSMVYRKNGIYAQNQTVGILNFNLDNNVEKSGTLGIYKIAEPIDRIFIKRYFTESENDGDLFKCSWGNNCGMPNLNTTSESSFGVDNSKYHNQKQVSYALKTNKSTSKLNSIRSFLSWINGESDLYTSLSNYMDEDYFLTFLAIQYLSGDWDNFLYDSNNYYLYFNESGKCFFIPYDMDRTYGCQSKCESMAFKKCTESWNKQGYNNLSNLLKKTIFVTNSSLMEKYKLKISSVINSVLNDENFKDCYYKIENNYKNDIFPTIKTLVNDESKNVSSHFYHLNISPNQLIKLNDSSDYNNAVIDSYFPKKRNC